MEIFTDIEKRILEATDKNYKWIARDENGRLYIYNVKPYKDEGCGFLVRNLVTSIYLTSVFLDCSFQKCHMGK